MSWRASSLVHAVLVQLAVSALAHCRHFAAVGRPRALLPFNHLVLGCYVFGRLGHMPDLAHDLSNRLAIGAAVLEDRRRPAIQPVSQILDRLHVARFAARDMYSC